MPRPAVVLSAYGVTHAWRLSSAEIGQVLKGCNTRGFTEASESHASTCGAVAIVALSRSDPQYPARIMYYLSNAKARIAMVDWCLARTLPELVNHPSCGHAIVANSFIAMKERFTP